MNRALWLVGTIAFCVSCFADENKPSEQVAAILALESDVDYGEYLGSECSTCHNSTNSDNGIPTIQGKEPSYLIQALLEYREEKRTNETMSSIAGALGDDEIAALASYFSSE